MSPEAQRIAIAEACGWLHVGKPNSYYKDVWFSPDHQFGDIGGEHNLNELPDYLNDLNAMHEAEKVLWGRNDWSACKYQEILQTQVMPTSSWTWHATAAQRAEAFLRTIGKWEDDQPHSL